MRSRLSPLLVLKKKKKTTLFFQKSQLYKIRDDFILTIAYNPNIKGVLAAKGKLV